MMSQDAEMPQFPLLSTTGPVRTNDDEELDEDWDDFEDLEDYEDDEDDEIEDWEDEDLEQEEE